MNVLLTILWYLFLVVQAVIAIYLLIPTLLLVIYGIFKALGIRTPFQRKKIVTGKQFEFGIIITAHQETRFVIPLVDSILKQTYPNYRVYVVADDCDISTLNFPDNRITVLRPDPPLNAKIRSIHYAIDNFQRKHDAVIIFDADNLIHPRFLEVMNAHFQKGYRVVQCDFKPKNTDSDYARMDAIGDMFNFFVEREGRMVLDLSAAIWGSGVAIDYDLYTGVKYTNMLGGFDKKLQSHLVLHVPRIAFAPDAVLFDEKISSGKSLETQRTRWISSYFKYFRESMHIMFTGLKRGSFNLIFFGFNVLRPPLFMVLGGGILMLLISFFVSMPLFYIWLAIFGIFILSFATIVAVKGKDIRYAKTFFMLPLFVFQQVMALFKLKKAKKSFLKTEHSSLVYIDELLKK